MTDGFNLVIDALKLNGIKTIYGLPGIPITDLTRKAREQVKGLNERVLARTPAGRWGVPADLAGIA
ncbi:MAG: oxalyl-CoA decarboxylase, partial [Rubrivivax sp.]|nr:oxalyl-CoA decarboxylase [Rubrivivax sp.]